MTTTSSNPEVATISHGKVTIISAGSTIITAMQSGNENIEAARPVERTLIVKKVIQDFAVSDFPVKTYGDPAFEINITTSSTLGVTATSSNPDVATVSANKINIKKAGEANITITLAGDQNHESKEVVKQLVIEKADQHIEFLVQEEEVSVGDQIVLHAIATSALPVSYLLEHESIVSIDENNVATLTAAGEVKITAIQAGNENYNAAMPVVRKLKVNIVLDVEKDVTKFKAYPNPVTNVLTIQSYQPIQRIEVADQFGRKANVSITDKSLDFSDVASGVYMVFIQMTEGKHVVKVVKQ